MVCENSGKNKKVLYADLSLFAISLIWGGGFIAMKGALDSFEPFNLLSVRFLISTVIITIIFWKRLLGINKKNIKAGCIMGILLFAGFAAQTIGLKYTTTGKNAFLTGTNVVIVPFIYWLVYKKAPDIYSFISAFLSMVGIGLLTLQGGFTMCLGDILTIICAIIFAFHIVSIQYFTEENDPIVLTIIQFAVTTVLSFICAFIFEGINVRFSYSSIVPMAYLILLSTVLAFIVQNIAQKYTPSTHAAIILCLESVFGSLLAVIILKEAFSIKMLLGCILIFAAIITAETKLEFLNIKGNKVNSLSNEIDTL